MDGKSLGKGHIIFAMFFLESHWGKRTVNGRKTIGIFAAYFAESHWGKPVEKYLVGCGMAYAKTLRGDGA